MKIFLRLILPLVLTLAVATTSFGRIWKHKDGSQSDGEILKATKSALVLKSPQDKRFFIPYKELADEEIVYLKLNYQNLVWDKKLPDVKMPNNAKAENALILNKNEIKSNESEYQVVVKPKSKHNADFDYIARCEYSSCFPIVKIKYEDLRFIWDIKSGKFHTANYTFDMKKRLSQADAIELAYRCESTYASVIQLRFLPIEYLGKTGRSEIEIGNIPQKNVAGIYMSYRSEMGKVFGKVKVEPDNIVKTNGKAIFSGALAHELCHQVMGQYKYPMAITEGVAEFVALSAYQPDGIMRFDLIERLLKSREIPRLKSYKGELESPPLSAFYIMRKKEFYNNKTVFRNYLLAQLFTIYFAKKDPQKLYNFISKAPINQSNEKNDREIAKIFKSAFPQLLGTKTEAQLQDDIVEFFKQYNINIKFTNLK